MNQETRKPERIYLSPPHIGELERQFVNEVFESNWIAPLGPQVDAFEREAAKAVGTQGAVALSSGTAAIHLALRLLNVSASDHVFCSSLTFVGSANPILYLGAEPVFIDSDLATWNMSPHALERAFERAKKTGKMPKAVIVVNLYGQCADLDTILSICQAYGVPLIEDAAESLGGTYKGEPSGGFGEFGILSFNGNKIVTTSGGGMLVSNNLVALEKARFWSTQARDAAPHYQHSEMGYNYRLSNVLAAIGRGQLMTLPDRVRQKRVVFDRYHQALGKMDGFSFMPEASFGFSNRWLTTLTIDPARARVTPHQIIEALSAENIEARPVWKPLHRQPLFEKSLYFADQDGHSVSDDLFDHGLCLPSGTAMTASAQDRVIEIVIRALKKA